MIFVRTLGTSVIEVGAIRIGPRSERKFALLLYLSVASGRRISRRVLRELVFPDQAEVNARHSLRQLVYEVRSLVAELHTDSDGLLLPTEAVWSDYGEILKNGQFKIISRTKGNVEPEPWSKYTSPDKGCDWVKHQGTYRKKA